MYNKPVFRGIVYFCAWLLLCLAFFEDPAVPGMGLPYWVSQDIMKSSNIVGKKQNKARNLVNDLFLCLDREMEMIMMTI